ncbi:MAG: hypothetical protein ABIA63_09950 [bacterium]
MNRFNFTVLITIITILFGTSNVYSILGIGFHGGKDFSTKVDGLENKVMDINLAGINVPALGDVSGAINTALDSASAYGTGPEFSRTDFNNLINFGPKLFIDAIPVIDLEICANISVKNYNFRALYPNLQDPVFSPKLSDTAFIADLNAGNEKIPMQNFDTTLFGYLRVASDVTVRYTFLKFPPVVNILKIYAGAGPSFVAATPIVDEQLFGDALNSALGIENGLGLTPVEFADVLQEKLTKEAEKISFKTAGHIMFGLQIKPPVLPLAVYGDGKYYFGMPKQAGTQGSVFLFNAGIALAF